jgi:hypothetical protein
LPAPRSRATKLVLAALLGAAGMCCPIGPAGAGAPAGHATVVAAPSTPNLIANSDFNPSPPYLAYNIEYFYSEAYYKSVHQTGPTFPGWAVGTASNADWGGVGDDHLLITPPDGSQQAVILYFDGAGTVSQTVRTVPGATYLLSWYGTGYPHGPGMTKVMNVLWDSNVVAAPSYDVSGHTMTDPGWRLQHLVVTATSPSSVVEFTDASTPPSVYASMVGNVSLAGDAKLYLPTIATVAPTGKLVAIVRDANQEPLVDPSLVVKLYGTYTVSPSGAPTAHLLASGNVLSGQVVLGLHLPGAAHTFPAYATLTGPGFIPDTVHLTIKVS